nr:hypothetical protein [uncultured Blautia sp.]
MKRILKKAGILLLVFLLGTVGTALLLNSEFTDNRSDFNDAVFPEVMIDMNGTLINRMYGYAQPMQTDFTRDSVTPLDTSKKLTFKVNPYDSEVQSFSYEIRTSDGSKVLENKKIKNLSKEDGYLSVDVEIGSDLRMNQEYSMQIALEMNESTAYYYTRVVSRSQVHASDYAAFVKYFYEACLDKNSADALGSYLEPKTTGASTNYSGININSSLSEVSWGTLAPQLRQEGIPVIKEINETTASVTLEYQITSQNENEETEIYDVKEFYRMKYQDTRIYLLDFRRSANQVFDGTLPVCSDDGIILGVRDKNVEYMMNDAATVIAFVQEGDLWSYSPGNEKINQIFSFRKTEDGDFRDSRTQHDIKIVRVTDEGDIDFVLYGYMNRGSHEGYEGIGVYHYNHDKNVAEERAFIPVSESFEFLKKDLEKLSYVNEKNELFLILAKNLYKINIEDNSSEILEKGIKNANFVSSDNNDHAAWLVSEGDEKGNIKEIDFDTCKTRLIAPQKEQKLRTVGFMNEDLIYGILDKSDILKDEEGHKSVGIRTLRIEDFDGNVKKEYQKDGLYITDISVGDTLIEFELSAKSGDTSYVAQKKDTIMNNKKAAANTVRTELVSASRTGVRVKLVFNMTKQTDSPLTMYAKVSSTDKKDIVLDTQIPQETAYYVYGQGELDSIYTDPAKAVQRADTLGGVVLNRAQQYVWERGNKKMKIQIGTEELPDILLQGTYDIKTLKKSLKKTGTVIDLSGCSLDSVLYEVSAQRPVIAKTGTNTSVLIVGYDEYNTYLYDPIKKETYPYGMNDSTDLFQKAGNVFITCIEKVNY